MSGLFAYTNKDKGKFNDGAETFYNKAEQAAQQAETASNSASSSAASASTSSVSASGNAALASSQAVIAQAAATAASTSETNAKSSEALSWQYADYSHTYSNAAELSKNSAKVSEDTAWQYQDWANNYKLAAEAAANIASTAQTTASDSAATALRESGLALDRSNTAKDWAVKTDGPVSGTEYSAKYWAQQAGSSVAGVTSFNGRAGSVTSVSGDYDVSQVTGAAPLASPSFTGSPKAPLPANTSNDSTIPSTQWVQARLSGKASVDSVNNRAPLLSPSFTGTPTVPTPLRTDQSRSIANTEWVKNLSATDSEMTSGVSSTTFVTPRQLRMFGQAVPVAASTNGKVDLNGLDTSYVYSLSGWDNGPSADVLHDDKSYAYGYIRTINESIFKVQELTTDSMLMYSETGSVYIPHRAIRTKFTSSGYTDWSVLFGSADVKYTPWVNIAGLNGWVNNSGQGGRSAYRKVLGRVFVEMNMTGGADGSQLFTLPEGLRPASNVFVPAVSAALEPIGLYVGPDGGVRFVTSKAVSNVATSFSFDVQ